MKLLTVQFSPASYYSIHLGSKRDEIISDLFNSILTTQVILHRMVA
jgi:hypothetical protein